METRILTIMFTDLKGFTERTSTQSREELGYLLEVQDELVRPILEKYKGTVIKTIGDAFMVTFESPTNAVHCGVEIQQGIVDHNARNEAEHHLHMRMGINSGEVSIKNGDVFGEPVNIASRIEGIAEPGEVYFTDSVYLAMNKNEILVLRWESVTLKESQKWSLSTKFFERRGRSISILQNARQQ
jgi:adenylate cyclase